MKNCQKVAYAKFLFGIIKLKKK